MSIGLVIRYTYDETCELCEKVALFIKKMVGVHSTSFLHELDMQEQHLNLQDMGYYEEAKALMTEKDNLK